MWHDLLTVIIIALILGIVAYLLLENVLAIQNRKKLLHVVYVNGTRGKSTVTRLIDSALREGGYKVCCKTTGTVPIIIGTDNVERPINRRGRANIKEQLWVLNQAKKQGAEILVCECMAVDPFLQKLSQEKMVRSDIGVITNVRLDHTEEMGATLEEICDSLSNTIPKNGVLFTSDKTFFSQLSKNAEKQNSRCFLADDTQELPDFNFKENIALALDVCNHLKVNKQTALKGMTAFKRDPFDLSVFSFATGGIFVNGMSINDPQSTLIVYKGLQEKYELYDKKLILLINNRRDRAYRTEHMISLAQSIRPDEIWVIGAAQNAVKNRLLHKDKALKIKLLNKAEEIDFSRLQENEVLFAVGNIASEGHILIEMVKKEAEQLE